VRFLLHFLLSLISRNKEQNSPTMWSVSVCALFFFSINVAYGDKAILRTDVDKSCTEIVKYNNILVTAAHPDDIETIAGGTVSYFTSCGKNVQYVITTNGDKGWGKDTSMSSEQLAVIREQEQLNAGKILNVKDITFFRQPDGRLDGANSVELKLNVTRAIRLVQPDLVLSFHPQIDYATYPFGLMHEDHRQTAVATMNSLWPSARDYLNYYEELYSQGILPWICPEAWLFSFSPVLPESNLDIIVVNITGYHYGRKLQALLQHESQYSDANAVAASLLRLGNYVAKSNFDPQVTASTDVAEAFVRILF
jgi:LmbE family N-acetylglucosaminyl deacetylase